MWEGARPSAPDNVVVGSFFRRPLAVFAAVMVVGFVLIAAGLAAFGGGSPAQPAPTPLSRTQFGRAASRDCMAFARQFEAVVSKKPANLRVLTRGVRRLTSLFDRLRTSWYALLPPSSDADSFRRLLGTIDAEDRAMHHLLHLTETRQWRSLVLFARFKRGVRILDRRLSSLANRLGIRCDSVSHTTV